MDIQAIKQRFSIIGNSPGLNYAISVAQRVAPTNLTVLITGESGVGKEIFAHIIHALSARKHYPFIAVNCGAIPEGTIDSELFGHEKGAFTGAHESRKGYFETVNKGTIFLDEVGELPLSTQARLLRVLETGEFIRVGSSKVHKTDVRVLAATNVNLLELVNLGKFREDLYYRLNTVPIHIPPLRERKEDIYLLFRKFSSDFAEKYRSTPIRLDPEAQQLLLKYRWPGNVRELKNITEQLSVLSEDKLITAEQLKKFLPKDSVGSNLPMLASAANDAESRLSERELMYRLLFDMRKDINELKQFISHLKERDESMAEVPDRELKVEEIALPQPDVPAGDDKPIIIKEPELVHAEAVEENLNLEEKEKELIKKALKKHKGKRKLAALDLGISERTLYRKIKEYGIEK